MQAYVRVPVECAHDELHQVVILITCYSMPHPVVTWMSQTLRHSLAQSFDVTIRSRIRTHDAESRGVSCPGFDRVLSRAARALAPHVLSFTLSKRQSGEQVLYPMIGGLVRENLAENCDIHISSWHKVLLWPIGAYPPAHWRIVSFGA
jgi:hypothetical protein